MRAVRTSVFAPATVEPAGLSEAIAGLGAARGPDGLHIEPDLEPGEDGFSQFPRMSIAFEGAGGGYIVQAWETEASRSDLLSTSAQLTHPGVHLELGGLAEELWPVELFVPLDAAVKAAEHFLLTAQQESTLVWVGLNVFPRVKLPLRR